MRRENKDELIDTERFSPLLPADMIVDILLRLPVKSLLRFKCVCKDLYFLVKSKDFIDHHFHHKTNRESILIIHRRGLVIESLNL
jgi:hypothetical protein